MSRQPGDVLHRVSNLQVGDTSVDIYNDWAERYDTDLIETFGYLSPGITTSAFNQLLPDTSVNVVDYGCGTGLVGEAMYALGYRNIDGIDISQGMLDEAEKKSVYRQLSIGDLTAQLNLPDNHYDGGLCVGSMGAGHVGAEHVQELLRPIRHGGLIVIYMNGAYYESDGFAAKFHELEQTGVWEVERQERSNYMAELDRPGYLVVAYKRC